MNIKRPNLDLPTCLEINKDQADELIEAIQSALLFVNPAEINDMYLFSKYKEAIVISFDGMSKPFLCHSYGLNNPSNRIPIYRTSFVLDTIAKALKILGRDVTGGRIFLNSMGAFCVDGDEHIELVRWKWPTGDLVSEIVEVRNNRLAKK